MRALVVKEFGGPEALVTIEVPVPEPRPGEIRLKVAGAGVNFADVMVRAGMLVQGGATTPREQYGMGSEAAGTIDAVGEGVEAFAVGEEVVGTQERLDLPLGPQAEFVVLEAWAIAPAPAGVPLVEAATFPLPAITADQALDTLDLSPGQWLLVTGAAGAVGGFAIELARLRGLRVVAQGSPSDESTLRDLGAELFASREAPLAPTVRELVPGGVHGALDAANLITAADDAVRHGGAYVNLLNSAPQSRRQVRTYDVAWHSDAGRLAKLSALVAAGKLTRRVHATYPLEDAAKAHEVLAQSGIRGRLILVP